MDMRENIEGSEKSLPGLGWIYQSGIHGRWSVSPRKNEMKGFIHANTQNLSNQPMKEGIKSKSVRKGTPLRF